MELQAAIFVQHNKLHAQLKTRNLKSLAYRSTS
jgi:hypothetical protein